MSAKPAIDDALTALLLRAHRDGGTVTVPADLEPACAADAYAIQHALIAARGERIAGWKVGAKSPLAPRHGAALPSDCVVPEPAYLARRDFGVLWLDLEIAFAFSRTFEPRPDGYGDDEVMASLALMAASIEIVSSRVAGWPDTGKLIQLADMQNHGALVLGVMVPVNPDFPFVAPDVELHIDAQSAFVGPGANPSGDPRRLLPWIVNHCSAQGVTLPAGQPITTGSYVGMHFPDAVETVTGRVGDLPPVRLMFV